MLCTGLVDYFGNSNLFHYLDDFFFAGKANTRECALTLNDMLGLCDAVQAPLKPEKVIGPSTQMIILGIELDTVLMQAQLSQDKLQSLLEELELFVSLTHLAPNDSSFLWWTSWPLLVKLSLLVGYF